MDATEFRRLLERRGAYPAIEAAWASDELRNVLPVKLFDHIGIVYDRLERIVGAHFQAIVPLRLAVLLHEEAPNALPRLVAAAGFSEFAPLIGGFGELWKTTGEDEIAAYANAHRAHLDSLLLFELAHEGRATVAMERAAARGGLANSFERWASRLATVPSPNARPARLRSGMRQRVP
jgi:hypothetical protein